MQHCHIFTYWEVNRTKLASRVLFQRPAHYVPEAMLRQHVQERVFPDRRLRRKTTDRVAFQAKCNELRLLAAGEEKTNPVSFAIGNSWNDTLRVDKQNYLEYTVEVPLWRHVSISFLDPVFGAMVKQACRQTLKSLAAECLVGVRLGLLNFLSPVCVDWLFWLLAFGAGGCLFWTDVVDTLPRSGLVGWCLESLFLLMNTATILSRTRCQFGNRPRGTAKSQDG